MGAFVCSKTLMATSQLFVLKNWRKFAHVFKQRSFSAIH